MTDAQIPIFSGPNDLIQWENVSGDIALTDTGIGTVQGLQTYPVAATAPTNGQVPTFNGTEYVPTTPSSYGTFQATGDGSTVAFVLAETPVTGSVRPFVGGNRQAASSANGSLGWSLSVATVTFGTAPANGTDVTIDYSY
jgi:hypothetical protein